MTFASAGGTDYMYYGGTGGTGLNRSALTATGTAVSRIGVTLSAASGTFPANFNDFGITASGRLLTVGENGFWLSSANQYTANAISLSQAVAFTTTENALTGDLGANARDFALVGNDLFAVTNSNIYRYTLDDTNGTLSFVSANAHGFNSGNVQIAAAEVVPEPTSLAAVALGGIAVLRRRRSV
jgi:hypothetical protein